MSNPIIKIVNVETGEEISREMTDEEATAFEAMRADSDNEAS